MNSAVSPTRQIRLRNYRYPGEVASLLLTFGILTSLYTLAIIFFPSNAKQVWQTLIITMLGLAVYVISVIVQQRSAFGTLVRTSPRQFPEIYQAGSIAAERLSIPMVPIYVKRQSEQNIYTLGLMRQPIIVITSSMIDQMSNESLQFFIGRELGHIRAGHTWLRTLLQPFGSGIPVIGKLLDSVIFGDWMNRTEFTADRAGFIACDSLTVAVSTMLKFGVGTNLYQKLDIREFLEQLNEVRSVGGRVTEIMATQPYLTQRIRRLVNFALSKKFSSFASKNRQNTGILEQLPHAFIDNSIAAFQDTGPTISNENTIDDGLRANMTTGGNTLPGLMLVAVDSNEKYELQRLPASLGRGSENDIIIANDDRVSRNHARIVWQDQMMMILDCNSRNGVWLNNKKIDKAAELKPNDIVRLGRYEFIFTTRD